MGFSKRKLFRSINRQFNFKDDNYVRSALDQIDFAIENEEVTDSFCNEYYKLKRDLEFIYPNLLNIVIGFITSIIITVALEAYILVFAILIPLGLIFSIWMVYNHITKQGAVLEPYLLKKMRKRFITVQKHLLKKSKTPLTRSIK